MTPAPHHEQITQHFCIQGWSGVAKWGGVSMQTLLDQVRPTPEARWVVFYSLGDGPDAGAYYDAHPIEQLSYQLTMLAYDMNDQSLSFGHQRPVAAPQRDPTRVQAGQVAQGHRLRGRLRRHQADTAATTKTTSSSDTARPSHAHHPTHRSRRLRPGSRGGVRVLTGTQSNVRMIRLCPGQTLPPHTHATSDLFLYAVEGRGELDTPDGVLAFEAGELAQYSGDEELRVANNATDGLTLLAFLAPVFPPPPSPSTP